MTIGSYALTVTAPARSRRATTLAAVKSRLGIADADTSQDAKLDRLINEASRALAGAAYLGRDPWRQGYTCQLAGYEQHHLYLPRFPVESVSAVTLSDAAVDDYSIAGEKRDRLYRRAGWQWTAQLGSRLIDDKQAGTEELSYAVDFIGGWLMPDEVSDWGAAINFARGAWARATDPANQLRFEATAVSGTGTTGGTEPTWPTAAGDTVTDNAGANQIVWTAYPALEMPSDLERVVWLLLQRSYYGDRVNPTAQSISKGGASLVYATTTVRRTQVDDEIAAILAEHR